MFSVLAVDTTSDFASLALLKNGRLDGIVGISYGPNHSERLLPVLDHFLSERDLNINNISGFAVSVGPGSFTGLRIGIAAVEGLAFATGCPCVGVSALDATAYRYRYHSGLIAVMNDAYRGEIYGAIYRSNGKVLSIIMEPMCELPKQFVEKLPIEPILFIGTGVRHLPRLAQKREEGNIIVRHSSFIAEEVALLGYERLIAGENDDLGELRALYVRPCDAEIAQLKDES